MVIKTSSDPRTKESPKRIPAEINRALLTNGRIQTNKVGTLNVTKSIFKRYKNGYSAINRNCIGKLHLTSPKRPLGNHFNGCNS